MAHSTTNVHTTAGRPERRAAPMTRLLAAIVALSLVGVGIAGYLTYTHFNEGALVCTIGSCKTVQESSYSTIGSIPISLLGLCMFTTLLVLSGLRLASSRLLKAETASLIAWAMLLTGILYYVYLTYVELFVLDAICQWCVGSSLVALLIFSLESVYLWRTIMNEPNELA